ncbi:hypothetical protein N0V90_004221 [Kalmusia sp. IMI 367209]|nr:hypothetical protein N0V90_004221 [Kalmusia sp. IMI 367209]
MAEYSTPLIAAPISSDNPTSEICAALSETDHMSSPKSDAADKTYVSVAQSDNGNFIADIDDIASRELDVTSSPKMNTIAKNIAIPATQVGDNCLTSNNTSTTSITTTTMRSPEPIAAESITMSTSTERDNPNSASNDPVSPPGSPTVVTAQAPNTADKIVTSAAQADIVNSVSNGAKISCKMATNSPRAPATFGNEVNTSSTIDGTHASTAPFVQVVDTANQEQLSAIKDSPSNGSTSDVRTRAKSSDSSTSSEPSTPASRHEWSAAAQTDDTSPSTRAFSPQSTTNTRASSSVPSNDKSSATSPLSDYVIPSQKGVAEKYVDWSLKDLKSRISHWEFKREVAKKNGDNATLVALTSELVTAMNSCLAKKELMIEQKRLDNLVPRNLNHAFPPLVVQAKNATDPLICVDLQPTPAQMNDAAGLQEAIEGWRDTVDGRAIAYSDSNDRDNRWKHVEHEDHDGTDNNQYHDYFPNTPRKVVYHSTGCQTRPSMSTKTYRECYGKDPEFGKIPRLIGTPGFMDRFDIWYGKPFLGSAGRCLDTKTAMKDSSFQIANYETREFNLLKAKSQATFRATRLDKVARDRGDKIRVFAEPRKDRIVHSQQFTPVRVSVDKNGTVEDTGAFLPVIYNILYEDPEESAVAKNQNSTTPPANSTPDLECQNLAKVPAYCRSPSPEREPHGFSEFGDAKVCYADKDHMNAYARNVIQEYAIPMSFHSSASVHDIPRHNSTVPAQEVNNARTKKRKIREDKEPKSVTCLPSSKRRKYETRISTPSTNSVPVLHRSSTVVADVTAAPSEDSKPNLTMIPAPVAQISRKRKFQSPAMDGRTIGYEVTTPTESSTGNDQPVAKRVCSEKNSFKENTPFLEPTSRSKVEVLTKTITAPIHQLLKPSHHPATKPISKDSSIVVIKPEGGLRFTPDNPRFGPKKAAIEQKMKETPAVLKPSAKASNRVTKTRSVPTRRVSQPAKQAQASQQLQAAQETRSPQKTKVTKQKEAPEHSRSTQKTPDLEKTQKPTWASRKPTHNRPAVRHGWSPYSTTSRPTHRH